MSAGGGGKQRPAEHPAEVGKEHVEGLPMGAPVHTLMIELPAQTGSGTHTHLGYLPMSPGGQCLAIETQIAPSRVYPDGQEHDPPLPHPGGGTTHTCAGGQPATIHEPPK